MTMTLVAALRTLATFPDEGGEEMPLVEDALARCPRVLAPLVATLYLGRSFSLLWRGWPGPSVGSRLGWSLLVTRDGAWMLPYWWRGARWL